VKQKRGTGEWHPDTLIEDLPINISQSMVTQLAAYGIVRAGNAVFVRARRLVQLRSPVRDTVLRIADKMAGKYSATGLDEWLKQNGESR
jgi:hypothetical protein